MSSWADERRREPVRPCGADQAASAPIAVALPERPGRPVGASAVDGPGGPVILLARRLDQCAFPLDAGGLATPEERPAREMLVCGDPVARRNGRLSSFCERHHRLCYRPASTGAMTSAPRRPCDGRHRDARRRDRNAMPAGRSVAGTFAACTIELRDGTSRSAAH
jgi:hypothetical protein